MLALPLAHDPVSFALVATLLAVAGVAAAWWPASRAARVEPATALRCD